MLKKTLFIITILIIGGLFVNGIVNFFQKSPEQKITDNAQNVTNEEIGKSSDITIKEKNNAGILHNISNFIKNPVVETFESFTQGEDTDNTNTDIAPEEIDPIKTALESYFIASSRINFPETKLISDAITLQKQGESQALETIIALLQENNKELYEIAPPAEAKTIHEASLWIGNKFIEVLEKILKASGKEEILEIIEGQEMQEIQEMVNKTSGEIKVLIDQYNLNVEI